MSITRRHSAPSVAYSTAANIANYAIRHPQQVIQGVRRLSRRFSEAFSTPQGRRLRSNPIPASGSAPGQSKRYAVSQGRSYVGASKYGGSVIVKGGFKKKKTFKRKSMKRMMKRKSKKGTLTDCLTKGYHVTDQIYGLAQDPSAVYITHSSWHLAQMTRVIIGAVLRKALRKAGISVPNKDTLLPLYNDGNSGRMEFQYLYQNPTSGAVAAMVTVPTATGSSFDTILGTLMSSGMGLHIQDFLSTVSTNQPHSFGVYSLDSGNQTTMMSRIYLQNEYFYIPVFSSLKFQNRTLPATGDATVPNIERSDVQPIKVKVFHFSAGTPRLSFVSTTSATPAVTTNVPMGVVNSNGLFLQTALTIGNVDYQEPPTKKLWTNCISTSNTVVDPGIIKYSSLKYTYKGTLSNLQAKLRPMKYDTGTTVVTGVAGKSQIICIDEYLRTTTSNKIAVSYEKDLRIGCYCVTKKEPAFTSFLNVPAALNIG
nr:putative capsid protein [Lake Sarah-associated circular virus-49]